ncbi:DoxX family protein [Vineibacter terrae]|uniref:DoxX family protein n=1 Tax=Vineibacter terrae TaxID=2586908 RepID=UPI001E29C86C|nr:DoxX family protein [Vineibacter terrae]
MTSTGLEILEATSAGDTASREGGPTCRVRSEEQSPEPARRADTPRTVTAILEARAFGILARVLLTFVFWTSGLAKLLEFTANAAMMAELDLHPGWAFNAATLVVQIGASLLIIIGHWTWLAAGALAVFTVLTIPIAHPFWIKEGEAAFRDMTVALEHVSVIGGLLLAAILSRRSLR